MAMIANDNSTDANPFGNDLEHASLGEIFVHDGGTEWEVVGAFMRPTLMLRRVGAPEIQPLDRDQIGRASWRERVCQSGSISVVAVYINKKRNKNLVVDRRHI